MQRWCIGFGVVKQDDIALIDGSFLECKLCALLEVFGLDYSVCAIVVDAEMNLRLCGKHRFDGKGVASMIGRYSAMLRKYILHCC